MGISVGFMGIGMGGDDKDRKGLGCCVLWGVFWVRFLFGNMIGGFYVGWLVIMMVLVG